MDGYIHTITSYFQKEPYMLSILLGSHPDRMLKFTIVKSRQGEKLVVRFYDTI